jgi:PAS domain S-box-containing protein
MSYPFRILIADDEEKIRKSLSGLLKEQGYEVMTVENGLECLQMMSAKIYDLVILDIVMPGIDGIEVLKGIKQRYNDMEVIMITGYADKEKAITALRLNAYDFIEKPFESKEILNTINNCLSQLRLRREVESKNQELKEAEKFIKNVIESVDEGFIVIDPEYKIISANKAYCNQIKMPLEDIIGQYCYEIAHQISVPCYSLGEECSAKHALETEVPWETTHIHYDTKKNPIHLQIKSFPIKDISGRITSTVNITNDITEKRKLENYLRHTQKMEAVRTLTGGIAHEFNNLLAAIIGYGKLLQEEIKEEPLQDYLSKLLLSSERATNLVKDLLTFSRKQILTMRPVKINEIIMDVEILLKRLITKDIELVITLMDEDAVVMADFDQIEQVLLNLVLNARDAMPDGGRLTISTEFVDLDKEYLKTYNYGKHGRYVLISVADTGFGIDSKTKERIFEPFFTTKEIGKGTGLGLSIIYGSIKQQNGYIDVESETGKGTKFKIYLPIEESYVEEP